MTMLQLLHQYFSLICGQMANLFHALRWFTVIIQP